MMKAGDKIEYRKDEYREFKNGEWSPWLKSNKEWVDIYDNEDQRFLNKQNIERAKRGTGESLDFMDCYRHWQLNKLTAKAAWKIMNEHLDQMEWQAEYLRRKGIKEKNSYAECINNCKENADIIRKYISEIGFAMRGTVTNDGTSEASGNAGIESHYFMTRLKMESSRTYNAIKKAIYPAKILEFDGSYFNFKIKANIVGLFFKEGGFTEWETIVQHIKIKGRISKTNTLKNANEGKNISEWDNLKKQLFD
jgi:hypothetical protein